MSLFAYYSNIPASLLKGKFDHAESHGGTAGGSVQNQQVNGHMQGVRTQRNIITNVLILGFQIPQEGDGQLYANTSDGVNFDEIKI